MATTAITPRTAKNTSCRPIRSCSYPRLASCWLELASSSSTLSACLSIHLASFSTASWSDSSAKESSSSNSSPHLSSTLRVS